MEQNVVSIQAPRRAFRQLIISLCLMAPLAGCGAGTRPAGPRTTFKMGDRAQAGAIYYNVMEADWKPALGDPPNQRIPKNRFLLVRVSITNSGGSDVTMPLLSVEDAHGKTYLEESTGEHVSGWMGLIRIIRAAQTEQGVLLFDVPLGAYHLLITDGGEPGQEKLARVEIPLRVDEDPNLARPTLPPVQ